uniref:Uncharacterized protein n=1 Tax=Rousettus aegyptiacus TaxID=9407 RepID=A0A7J8FJ40_ROUAE|nr:hypothetical protein HJG63_012104 [Rousettus aegyptiacus]
MGLSGHKSGLVAWCLVTSSLITQSQAASETHALGNSQQSFSSWFDLFFLIVKHFTKMEGLSNTCGLRRSWVWQADLVKASLSHCTRSKCHGGAWSRRIYHALCEPGTQSMCNSTPVGKFHKLRSKIMMTIFCPCHALQPSFKHVEISYRIHLMTLNRH